MTVIGIINTGYKFLDEMPIQPKGAEDSISTITIKKEYQAGLNDLDGFSHIYLIYKFHKSHSFQLNITPFLDNKAHGVFATRAPNRPSPIGLSLVKLIAIKNNILTISGADMLDGTPLLDIKPYSEFFDNATHVKNGWLNVSDDVIKKIRSDKRFTR